ncbi:MAG: hypothetical protein L3J00_03755 [Thiomicrorhabdus sp.]|nr:hypothetical protein [Thiomicrorhabdus sp.]
MNEQKAKFTWHYYIMASGALLAMLAGTLGSINGVVTGLALSLVSLPRLQLKTLTRLAFMAAFVGLYVYAFPDPDVVREKMAGQHIPMDPDLMRSQVNPQASTAVDVSESQNIQGIKQVEAQIENPILEQGGEKNKENSSPAPKESE